jgi:hypothetical protein
MFERRKIKDASFRRITSIIERGYVLDMERSSAGGIWFRHPGKAPSIILYSDGELVAHGVNHLINPDGKFPDRIINSEESTFDRWLLTVRRPTWLQKTCFDLSQVALSASVQVLFWSIILAAACAVSLIGEIIQGN